LASILLHHPCSLQCCSSEHVETIYPNLQRRASLSFHTSHRNSNDSQGLPQRRETGERREWECSTQLHPDPFPLKNNISHGVAPTSLQIVPFRQWTLPPNEFKIGIGMCSRKHHLKPQVVHIRFEMSRGGSQPRQYFSIASSTQIFRAVSEHPNTCICVPDTERYELSTEAAQQYQTPLQSLAALSCIRYSRASATPIHLYAINNDHHEYSPSPRRDSHLTSFSSCNELDAFRKGNEYAFGSSKTSVRTLHLQALGKNRLKATVTTSKQADQTHGSQSDGTKTTSSLFLTKLSKKRARSILKCYGSVQLS